MTVDGARLIIGTVGVGGHTGEDGAHLGKPSGLPGRITHLSDGCSRF